MSTLHDSVQIVFDDPSAELYSAPVQHILDHIFPSFEALPQVKWTQRENNSLSVFLLCKSWPGVGKFFYDIMSRWLVPGKRLNSPLFFSTNFRLLDGDDELYTLSKMVICPDSEREWEVIQGHLLMMENEVRLGALSVYHASRILELKGLSADEKTALIQERIAMLVRKRSLDFDYDIFGEMQHFLVACREEFKAIREHEQMARMICVFYLFRRILSQKMEESPERRHLCLKLVKTRLHLPLGIHTVLGVFVGLNLLNQHEVFEERHVLRATQQCLPGIRLVEDSFFLHAIREDGVRTLYLEIEKGNKEEFSSEELRKLKKELPDAIKASVEQLTHPVFMPRNEEEVMRNILTLSYQLKYLRDLPQVILAFDEQRDGELTFTVILLRILSSASLVVQELFHTEKTMLPFTLERIRKVGVIRKKYPKEASVLRVRLPASRFIRGDHTVDLYKARQEVIAELQRILGDVRDFNGGMISKQIEAFLNLSHSLEQLALQHELLLENFFHSISPVEMRSVLPPEPLKKMFLMLLNRVDKKEAITPPFVFDNQREASRVYTLIGMRDLALKQKVDKAVENLCLPTSRLVCLSIKVFDVIYLGHIYLSEDGDEQNLFVDTVQQALDPFRN